MWPQGNQLVTLLRNCDKVTTGTNSPAKGLSMSLKHVYARLTAKQPDGVGLRLTLSDGTNVKLPDRFRLRNISFEIGDRILIDLEKWFEGKGRTAQLYIIRDHVVLSGVSLDYQTLMTGPVPPTEF